MGLCKLVKPNKRMQNQQNQQQSQPPYLFYSENCEHSQRIIKLIRENPALVNGVKPISIEKAASLPPNLTSVPAIMYGDKLFTGNDANNCI